MSNQVTQQNELGSFTGGDANDSKGSSKLFRGELDPKPVVVKSATTELSNDPPLHMSDAPLHMA